MKASELIRELADQIAKHGDLPVTIGRDKDVPALVSAYDDVGRSYSKGDSNADPETNIHVFTLENL